ncbi:MAG: hypothetical protein O3A92_17295 [Verrucomicrobia bacterium]|nr:hypothetical protein [Verrucomicrobiota bacterium]
MMTWFEESAAVGVVLCCRDEWRMDGGGSWEVEVRWKRVPRRRAIRNRKRVPGRVARRGVGRGERKTGSLSIMNG